MTPEERQVLEEAEAQAFESASAENAPLTTGIRPAPGVEGTESTLDGQMFGFNDSLFEIWRDTGNADFPFEPLGFRPYGLMSADAMVKCAGTLIFPAHDGIVYRLNGNDPVRISNHHIDRLIQEDAAQDELLGFSWVRGGHAFINFIGPDVTMRLRKSGIQDRATATTPGGLSIRYKLGARRSSGIKSPASSSISIATPIPKTEAR